MNDTSPEIERKLYEMFQSTTNEERFVMGADMCNTSRYLVTCAIQRDYPNISEKELKKEVFLRYYRDDFSPEELEKIIQYLLS